MSRDPSTGDVADGPRRRATIVALEGLSGAGKTTVGQLVARRVGAALVPEAYRRLRPTPSLTWRSGAGLARLEARLLREDGRRYRAAVRLAASGRTVLLDTGGLGPLTYVRGLVELGSADPALLARLTTLTSQLEREGRWGLPDRILWISSTGAERRRRVAGDRRHHPERLAARHEAVGRIEERLYRGPLGTALGPRLVRVSGSGTATEVAERVARAVRGTRVRPSSPAQVRRVLESVRRASGNR